MSRDIQLFHASHLPAAQDDLFNAHALGMPGNGGPAGAGGNGIPPKTPLKKIQQLLRGREKLAIGLGVACAIIGAIAGWVSQKQQFVSNGVVWIRPIIPRLLEAERVMP